MVLVDLFGCVLSSYCLHDCGSVSTLPSRTTLCTGSERKNEREAKVKDALFFPPGCSSENVVRSYTFPFAIIHNDSLVLWVETSAIEYLRYVLGDGSFDNGVMKIGSLVPAAAMV